MASKHITSSRSLFLSSPPSPSPSFPSETKKPSSTTFQKSSLYVCEEAAGHGMALEHIQLRLLRDKFTSFMFPPLFVSIAGAFMKRKSIYLGLSKARLNTDIAFLSNGGLSNSQCTSALRFAPPSQIRLLWRTPWIYTTFGRAYASAAESRKREMGVLDEVEDDDRGDAQEASEIEEDSDVEDEQRIEDSGDEEEEDQQPQSQGPAKKKILIKVHKSKPPDQQGRLLNENITARTIRLVNDDAKGHRIVSRDEALTLAKGRRMDLVLVDGRANPPVCKIFDFNKEEYKQDQILKDRKKQKGATARLNEVKELRFTSKTESKDLKMKVEQAKGFMDRGYRVKFVAMFKGKPDDEIKRLEEEKMIDAIFPMIEDVAAIEQGPRVESRQAWVMLRHLKFSKKKPPKREPQIGATERVERVKQEDYAYSEPDFNQGQEENIMHAQNASIVSEAAAMGRLQGYPSKLTSPSTKPFAFQSSHPQVQPPPLQDIVDTFSPQRFSPPLHGSREETQSLQGFGGSQGSERAVSPPPGLQPSMPASQRAGVQRVKIPTLRPSVSPLPASSLQGNEGAQIHKPQASPLDGMLPPQSEQHPSHTPKIQRFSMPSQSPGILSQKQSSNNAPHADKAIGSEAAQGEYPAASLGRGIPPPKQPAHSLFSPTPPISLQGSPSNLQGPLLNFSQSPQMPTGIPRHGPANLQGPLPNASPSLQESLSHQGGLANLESPLADFFPSSPPPTFQHAPSSSQSSQPYPSPFVPSQNVHKRDSLSSQGSESLPPRGVPQYPPSPLQGLPPRGVPPRYPPPPIGQPSYAPPLGQPIFQDSQRPQGQFAPGYQTQQWRGPDSMHHLRSQPRPALDTAAAQNSPQQPIYKPEQGQDRYAPAPNLFGSRQHPQQGSPNLFGSPQPPQQGAPNPFGAPDYPQQGPPNLFGTPDYSQQGSPNLFRPPQQLQQGPPSFFGPSQHPQQGPPNFIGSPQRPQQGSPNLFGSPQRPQQGSPNLFGSPQRPQQGSPNLFGSPPRPQQGPPNLFGSQPYIQQRPPEPSQIQFGHQPASVPQGPRQGGPWLSQQGPPRHPSPMPSHPQQTGQPPSQGHQGYFSQQEAEGGPWLSQQAPSRHPSPMPSHPQQTGQPPSQGHQGYFAQQEAEGGDHKYWQSQALQGNPPQQNQAPQSYPPPQRGFPQTRGLFGFQGDHTQNQASQQPPPPRGFPQTRPVVPSPPGFRPAWSNPPQSQEYSPLFELPSDKS